MQLVTLHYPRCNVFLITIMKTLTKINILSRHQSQNSLTGLRHSSWKFSLSYAWRSNSWNVHSIDEEILKWKLVRLAFALELSIKESYHSLIMSNLHPIANLLVENMNECKANWKSNSEAHKNNIVVSSTVLVYYCSISVWRCLRDCHLFTLGWVCNIIVNMFFWGENIRVIISAVSDRRLPYWSFSCRRCCSAWCCGRFQGCILRCYCLSSACNSGSYWRDGNILIICRI